MTTKRKRIYKLLKTICIQVFPVMIGVYLGLVANNWNEENKEQALQNRLLESMNKELIANEKNVEKLLIYHKGLLDSIRTYQKKYSLKEQLELSPDQFMSNVWRGTKVGSLKNAAYQTAMVTGALAGLDIDLAIQLSEVDLVQKDYSAIGEKYLNSLIQMDTGANLQTTLQFISPFCFDIISFEEALLRLYKKTNSAIEQNLSK
ncbi:MAG: hypothetical protein NXI23_01415 [Bacteroidetes bacterium]|jgi:putative NADH-flavin reductase|nr:hypothetical protein [Bacteroidota bacterium]